MWKKGLTNCPSADGYKNRRRALSNTQYFTGFVIANGDPVWLRGTPLNLIHFTFGSGICENWVFDCTWHLLNVPNERLVIVSGRTNMTRANKTIAWINFMDHLNSTASTAYLCGAQAMPFTHARWLDKRATGVHGTRTSRMITSHESIATVAK